MHQFEALKAGTLDSIETAWKHSSVRFRLASWITGWCALLSCLPESSDFSGYSREWSPALGSAGIVAFDGYAETHDDGGVGGSLGSAGGTEGAPILPLTPPSTGGSGDVGAAASGGAAVVQPPAAGGSTGGAAGTATEPPPPEEPSCDFGVLSPDGTTCLIRSLSIASWQAARDACSADQASLAKVESAAEDVLISGLGSDNLWLGGSDTITDNVFVWLDGTPVTFGNWGLNQPDRFPGADCIEKRPSEGGLWFDQPCFNERFFVCEKPSQ